MRHSATATDNPRGEVEIPAPCLGLGLELTIDERPEWSRSDSHRYRDSRCDERDGNRQNKESRWRQRPNQCVSKDFTAGRSAKESGAIDVQQIKNFEAADHRYRGGEKRDGSRIGPVRPK